MRADDLEGQKDLVSNVDRQWTGVILAAVDGGQQSSIGENKGGKAMG